MLSDMVLVDSRVKHVWSGPGSRRWVFILAGPGAMLSDMLLVESRAELVWSSLGGGRWVLFGPGSTSGQTVRPFSSVGNAVPGVPTAEGGDLVRFAGALHLRNAGDGVPYGSDFDVVCAKSLRLK